MLDFVLSLLNTIGSILGLLIEFIKDIPAFLKALVEILGVFPSYLFFVPDRLITAFGVMTAFALVYKFLGREG